MVLHGTKQVFWRVFFRLQNPLLVPWRTISKEFKIAFCGYCSTENLSVKPYRTICGSRMNPFNIKRVQYGTNLYQLDVLEPFRVLEMDNVYKEPTTEAQNPFRTVSSVPSWNTPTFFFIMVDCINLNFGKWFYSLSLKIADHLTFLGALPPFSKTP